MRTGAAIVLLCAAIGAIQAQDRPISYTTLESDNAIFHAVIADFRRDDVTGEAVLAPKLVSSWSLVGDSGGAAAITGTFFAWENQKPVADVLIDGELKAQGRLGSVVAFDWFGKPHIFDAKVRQELDWFPYRYALRGGVRVLSSGAVNPYPQGQGFKDSSIWGSAMRTAVGLTADGRMILAATRNSVQLSHVGKALKKLGAVDGICLDGGGSTMMYYRGQMVIGTQRRLCNVLVLHERSPYDMAYQRHVKRISTNQADGAVRGVIGTK